MSYHLFEVYGIELEYMLIDSNTFRVNPVVDKLLTKKHGALTSDVSNGKIEWSNELVAHVVELKTNGPTSEIEGLDVLFAENVKEINLLLKDLDSRLLPAAAHPLMNPKTETKLWEHDYSAIYTLYNRIFDCSGHGWSNVQSMHINLPFYGDEEFESLHAAVRLLLPIIPGLAASSPLFEGQKTGFMDTRMEFYKTNQKEIPEMTGKVIPERVFSKKEYSEVIFEPIKRKIRKYDTDNILDKHFLNSRGAIARFDRNAIEIRVIDLQECPKADLAIAILIIESLKLLVSEELIALEDQKQWHEDELFDIFNKTVRDAENAEINNKAYSDIFDLKGKVSVGQVWLKLYERVKDNISERHRESIEFLLKNGSLSNRILNTVGEDISEANIKKLYLDLADCLQQNKFYKP